MAAGRGPADLDRRRRRARGHAASRGPFLASPDRAPARRGPGGPAGGAGRGQDVGHAQAPGRGNAAGGLRASRRGRAPGGLAAARGHGPAVVPQPRRAGAAAFRPSAARAVLRPGLVAAGGAGAGDDGLARRGIRARPDGRHRRRGRHPDAGQRACRLAAVLCPRRARLRPRLGAGGRCRACRPSAGGAGPEPGPGRRGLAGRGDRRARALAAAGRRDPAAPARPRPCASHACHGRRLRRAAAPVRQLAACGARAAQPRHGLGQPASAAQAAAGLAGPGRGLSTCHD